MVWGGGGCGQERKEIVPGYVVIPAKHLVEHLLPCIPCGKVVSHTGMLSDTEFHQIGARAEKDSWIFLGPVKFLSSE